MQNKKSQTQKPKAPQVNETEDLKSQLARVLADYDNLRKRSEAEKHVWFKFAKQDLLVKLLPVIDTLEIAQKHLGDKGLELAMNQFMAVLKEEGIEEVETKVFDANLHEALETVEGGESGHIAEVLVKGYKFNDGTVVRHAKVKVFQGTQKTS